MIIIPLYSMASRILLPELISIILIIALPAKRGHVLCVLDLGSSVRIDCHYFLHISSGQITDSHTVNCNSVLKFRV